MATMSIAPSSQISSDNNVVTAEVFIAAPRERIFEALTDPKQALRWWGQKDNYILNQFQMDVRVGGKGSTSGTSARMGGAVNVVGEFLEIDPPPHLAYSWIKNWMPVVTKALGDL